MTQPTLHPKEGPASSIIELQDRYGQLHQTFFKSSASASSATTAHQPDHTEAKQQQEIYIWHCCAHKGLTTRKQESSELSSWRHDAVSSSQLDHSSSMLDFLKGTLKEVPRLYF